MNAAPDVLNLVSLATEAAKAAGEVLRGQVFSAVAESAHDVKSEGDIAADARIREVLSVSGFPILSEETWTPGSFELFDKRVWIVDPLDGTVNYQAGNPLNCVSIALWEKGEPLFGVVFDFSRGELYAGGPGMGAFCNGEAIESSAVRKISESVLLTGFPSGRCFDSEELGKFAGALGHFRKVRLLGSAALSLAWVSRGWASAYEEEGIYLWDVAAGIALVLGAGGRAAWTRPDPELMKTDCQVSCSQELLEQMIGRGAF